MLTFSVLDRRGSQLPVYKSVMRHDEVGVAELTPSSL